jgi:hypothetical protein
MKQARAITSRLLHSAPAAAQTDRTWQCGHPTEMYLLLLPLGSTCAALMLCTNNTMASFRSHCEQKQDTIAPLLLCSAAVGLQEDEFDEDVDDKANAVYLSRHDFDAVRQCWKDVEVPVFCKCNLPYNPDLDMVQCEGCNEWCAAPPLALPALLPVHDTRTLSHVTGVGL